MVRNEETEGRQGSPPIRTEYEVELMDYLRVIWKYRFWIIGATVLSAVAALVISFMLPPIWEVSMVAEPGRFGSDVFESGGNRPSGKIYFLDTAENVKAKIVLGSYDYQVRALSGWGIDEDIEWDVNVQKNTSAIRVSLEVEDKHLGIKALDVLASSLKKEFAGKVRTFQSEIEQNIEQNREDITKVRKDVERVETEQHANLAKLHEEVEKLKKEISLLKQRESELSQEEQNVRKNTEFLMVKRNSLIEGGESRSDPVALLLYTTSLQQNIAYSNQLASQLNDVRRLIEDKGASVKKVEIEMVFVKEDAGLRIKKLESEIQKVRASIKMFEERKNFTTLLEIVQQPTVGPRPVKPKKKLNGALAGIFGLFVSVFGAFFTEYIGGKKEKK